MTVRFMITAVMGALLLGWVIFCGVQFIFQGRRRIAGADFIGQVKCEKCGTEYTVSPQEFNKGIMTKTRSLTKTQVYRGAFVDTPHYAYYAKKFYCPCCKKREYAQVLNINEIDRDMRKTTVKIGLHWLAMMFIGGMLILVLGGIPIYFADRAARKQAEDMRQQRYEELKERYFQEDTE